MDIESMIIAIDGPAGAGKSSVAQKLASSLGLNYLDTGAIYRALTLEALRDHSDLDDAERLSDMARSMDIQMRYYGRRRPPYRILLNGEDVTRKIRSGEVSVHVSQVSSHKGVRLEMIRKQRRMAEKGGIVVEGRDVGTAVFPEADLKIFLTASLKERALRRYREMKKEGYEVSINSLQQEMVRRDHQDTTRAHNPLKKAHDAMMVDTTDMSVSRVVRSLIKMVKERADTIGEGGA
ncbi:MAG: (d)CMP kinase [Actinomycetota bacterium]|nr:(d)CMP kinase [Actinomycetota bacterium]